jgi:small subunit ribosomal protein S17
MADETENETPETPETPDAEVTQEAPETPAAEEATEAAIPEAETPDASEAEAQTAEAETPAPEAEATPQAEAEPDAEEPPAEEPAAQEAPEAAAPAAPVEPEEQLSAKERRRKARSTHSGEVGKTRSPEERHSERLAIRKDKAARRRTRRLAERAKAAERRANAPAPEPLAPVHAVVEGARRVRQGIVVSDKGQKTITVRIDTARRHRRYEKIVRSSSTLHAHDENNEAHEGDTVRVIESRPLSRTKRWKLVDVLERAR